MPVQPKEQITTSTTNAKSAGVIVLKIKDNERHRLEMRGKK